MSAEQRRQASRKSKARPRRSEGTAWTRATSTPPAVGPAEREAFVVVVALRAELGREPTRDEMREAIARRLGVRDARPLVDALERLGLLTLELSRGQRRTLIAIATLRDRLGTSPSTAEVSAEMGLSPSASRYHINALAALGLCTRPEMRLVLDVTDLGRVLLPEPEKG